MLRWRLILGTVFVAALVGLFVLDAWLAGEIPLPPGVVLVPLALTVAGAAAREYSDLVKTREPEFDGTFVSILCWILVASPWFGVCVGGVEAEPRWQLGAFVVGVLLIFFREMLRYDKDSSKRVTERLALSVFGLVYIGLLMSFVVRLRLTPYGMWPLISMLVVVKMGDVGAYTVGRLFGKHKLAPKLSPGKTWEGFAGGLLFSVIGGMVFGYLTGADERQPISGPEHDWMRFIVFSLVVSAVGVVGDLAESLLKRDFGVKDSSTWMPGFGGVLDLIDSPLLAAPVAWAFWEFGGLMR